MFESVLDNSPESFLFDVMEIGWLLHLYRKIQYGKEVQHSAKDDSKDLYRRYRRHDR